MSDVPVSRVLAPNPGVYTLEGTNTWVVGRSPAVVIDPGPDDEGHLRAVAGEADRVAAILLTHAHEDHADGARRLAQMVSAPVRAIDTTVADVPLADGERLDFGDAHLEVFHMPGHTPDHAIFRLRQTGAIFSGDMVLGRGTSVIDPPEGDLTDYLHSLERLLQEGPKTLFPGHGPTIFAGELKVREYMDHRRERDAQVLAALGTDAARAADLVPTIYATYPPEVYPLAERSVLAHLLKLHREEKVERQGAGDDARWTVARERVCSRCGRPVRGKAPLCPRCSMDALQERPEAD